MTAAAANTITNTATVSGNEQDPNLSNNTSSVTTTVIIRYAEQVFYLGRH